MMRGQIVSQSSGLFRDEIEISHLQSLKENLASGDLNEEQFVNLFHEVINPSLSKSQLTELFQKIDADSSGRVDWDELTNYMFLSGDEHSPAHVDPKSQCVYDTSRVSYQSQPEARVKHPIHTADDLSNKHYKTRGRDGPNSRKRENHHREEITRVLRLDKANLLLTSSRDGSLRTWCPTTLNYNSCVAKNQGWITDCCILQRTNRLVVSSMNRTLSIYDLSSLSLIGDLPDYSKSQCIPLCVYCIDRENYGREAVAIGDDKGGVSLVTCPVQWMSTDGRSYNDVGMPSTLTLSAKSSVVSDFNGVHVNDNDMQTADVLHDSASPMRIKAHNDWITRLTWIADIHAIVATSLDSTISVIDINRMTKRFDYTQHQKSVFDIVWCPTTRFLASCGMERDISIWNPYSSQRAVGSLRGHAASVMHLVSDDENNQIISVSADNIFKVWDIRTQQCLQTFSDDNGPRNSSRNTVSALLHDKSLGCVISAKTHLTSWPRQHLESNTLSKDTDSHTQDPEDINTFSVRGSKQRETCKLALYNCVFHQIVTAELGSDPIIRTWNADTGKEVFSYQTVHGYNPICAIAFDFPGRRLLTAAHDEDSISMWNFSNGALVKNFMKKGDDPVLKQQNTAFTRKAHKDLVARPNNLRIIRPSSSVQQGSKGSPRNTSEACRSRYVAPVSSTLADTRPHIIKCKSPHNTTAKRDSKIDTCFKNKETLPKSSQRKHIIRSELHDPHSSDEDDDDQISLRFLLQNHNTDMPQVPSKILQSNDSAAPENQENGAPVYDRKLSKKDSRISGGTTLLLYVERNVRVGMGDCMYQRLVCSAGWDSHIHVWEDKSDERKVFAVKLIPYRIAEKNYKAFNQEIMTKQHSKEVLAMTYISPAYLVTAGLDGKILLWSFNSGDFVANLYESRGSIETVFYAEKIEVIFAAGEVENLVCIDRSTAKFHCVPLFEADMESHVTAVRCDRANTIMVTADNVGRVKVWGLRVSGSLEGIHIQFVAQWMSFTASLISIDLIERSQDSELGLLTSSEHGEVQLWTLIGNLVGTLGKHLDWGLRDLKGTSSDSELQSKCAAQNLEDQTSTVLIPCTALSSLLSPDRMQRDKYMQDDPMPKAGEVWICYKKNSLYSDCNDTMICKDVDKSVYLSACNSSVTLSQATQSCSARKGVCEDMKPHQKVLYSDLFEKDIMDLITIIRIFHGEITCWSHDGHEFPTQKSIKLNAFVRNAHWRKHQLLTQYIFRVFHEAEVDYQVRYISIKPPKNKVQVVDRDGVHYDLQPLSSCILPAQLDTLHQKENSHLCPVKEHDADTISSEKAKDDIAYIGSEIQLQVASWIKEHLKKSGHSDGSKRTVTSWSKFSLPALHKSKQRKNSAELAAKISATRSSQVSYVDTRRTQPLAIVPKQFRALLNMKNQEYEQSNTKKPRSQTATKITRSSKATLRKYEAILPRQ